jgi:hypothetical protein
LDANFTKLCWHASHDLKRKNSQNNFIDDPEDIKQELCMSMWQAGIYHKRQTYIEKCLNAVKKFAKDEFMKAIIVQLDNLWQNRKRHGAGKQKFGDFQEQLLERIVRRIVPKSERPDKKAPLVIDEKFSTYCKSIVWNKQKQTGKKISKEKVIRNGMISLSENDHLI